MSKRRCDRLTDRNLHVNISQRQDEASLRTCFTLTTDRSALCVSWVAQTRCHFGPVELQPARQQS